MTSAMKRRIFLRGILLCLMMTQLKSEILCLNGRTKVDTIWVQCDMGMSRSAGISAGILKALGQDNSFILGSKMYYPNMLCYRKTLNAFTINNQ